MRTLTPRSLLPWLALSVYLLVPTLLVGCGGGSSGTEPATETPPVTDPAEADLSVAKTVDNSAPLEGDTIIYTVTLTNNGPQDATGVRLSDVLPAGLNYTDDDAAVSGTFYDSATGVWTVGNLSNAGSTTLHLTATVNPGTGGGTLTNTASVTASDQPDPVPGNDSAAVDVTVAVPATSADLAVTKNVDNANPSEGDTIVYTVTLTNNGLLDATNVSVTDVLPTGMTYSSDDAAASGTTYDSASGLWTLGTLRNGQTRTLRITATVNPGTGGDTLTNTASVTTLDQSDPVPGNNSATVDLTVVVPDNDADLAVTKSVDNANPSEGDTVIYTVTVTNNGPLDATNVSVTDLLPTGLSYSDDDAAASGTTYDSASGLWTLGTLPSGQTATLQLTATLNAGTGGSTLTNMASVSALDQTDPVPGNDSAAVDVSVAATSGSPPVGLVDYWKLDETGGTSYLNVVAGGPSANCSACPTPVAGRVGGAQEFDGVSQEVTVADDSSFDWSHSARFSIEAWIKRGSPCSVTGEAIIGRYDASSLLEWSLGCAGSNARFMLIDTSGAGAGADLVGSTDIGDGQWHHLVAMRDAISGKNFLYVDGVEEASAAVNYAGNFAGITGLNIGWLDQGGADYHFAGAIDEIAIHDRVLSDSGIRRHYADGVVGLQRGYQGCGAPVRIMPLGDSITRRWNPGYRPGLYFDLVGAGMDVDMVGSVTDSCAPTCSHDPDNEGHSGFAPTDIAGNVATWLNQNPPDVVTLHIGTNVDPGFPYPDVTQVGAILDQIKTYNPDIPVVLARIINKARSSYDPQLSVFNQNLEAMAQARVAAGDRILVVDQEPVLDYSAATTDFPVLDDLHPTADGFAKMVPVWFEGLNRFMPACNSVTPQVISQPVTTGSSAVAYLYVVNATGVPVPSFSLTAAPAGMTIHPDTGRIDWIPPSAGSYDVTVQVSNIVGSGTQSFTIVVN